MNSTTIISNGSKWFGEQPDTVEKLLAVLKENMLDPQFSEYGNFITPEGYGTVRFFGNFHKLSHVFNIRTDDPKVIAKLTRAIRENLRREDYRAVMSEIEARREKKEVKA